MNVISNLFTTFVDHTKNFNMKRLGRTFFFKRKYLHI